MGREMPRKAAWFVAAGCRCSYEYGGTHWKPVEMPPWLVSIQASVWKVLAQGSEDAGPGWGPVEANSCVANFYEDGSNSVDWHADNEPPFEGLIGTLPETLATPRASCASWHEHRA